MVRNHPYQHLYFNKLAGKNMKEVRKKYELDYWGLAFLEGFKHLLDKSKEEKVFFSARKTVYLLSALFLDDELRNRLYYCPGKRHNYFTNFRADDESSLKKIGEKCNKMSHQKNSS